MVLKKRILWFIFYGFLMLKYGAAEINFGSKESAIKLGSNTTFYVLSAGGMDITEGTLIKESNASNIIGNDISFISGVLLNGDSKSDLDATYRPGTGLGSILLAGEEKIIAEPGTVYQSVNVSNVDNLIGGQPTFNQNIVLQDANTTLTLAIQSKLNKNIVLNGGTLQLGDNLNLADNVILSGNGRVNFNSRQIAFGGKELTWNGNIYWSDATDMVLNSKTSLSSTWSFGGTSNLNGNGNILDLSLGGTLWVKKNTTLYLTDIKLKGLGSGYIVFEDKTSQIRLSNVSIEMDDSVTITTGGVYVEGPVSIITKDNLLTFDQNGSLTVDGVTLWYDVLNNEDEDNIRPVPNFDTDGADKNITLTNGAVIRLVAGEGEGSGEEIGDIHYKNAATINYTTNVFLSSRRKMYVENNVIINGENHYIQFSRESSPLIIVSAGKSLTLNNITLRDVSPEQLSGNIIFGDNVIIELSENEILNSTWKFGKDCVIKGNGHSLTFDSSGTILIGLNYSAIVFDNITLEDISGNHLACMDDTGTMSFNNVKWLQDADYSFTKGTFEVLSDWTLKNDYMFVYQTSKQSIIWQNAKVTLDLGFTFSYAPSTNSRNLITLTDATSQIYMNGATLNSTTTGLQLSKGTLVLSNKNYVYNSDTKNGAAVSLSQAVAFGDGTNDLNIVIYSGGSIQAKSGILHYRNTN